jgi:prepilin-type N-terminal cleavage/methylation domain-containing protein
MKQNPISRNRQRGFNLLEILVVLAVIGILIAFIAPRIIPALSGARGTGQISEINELAVCIQKTYGTRADFSTLTAATVALSCAKDNRRVGSGTTTSMVNASGATVTFTIPTAAPFDNVVIGWPAVPSDQCTDIVYGVGQSFTAVSGTPTGATSATVVKTAGGQINEANVPTACGTATTTTLSFTLNKG